MGNGGNIIQGAGQGARLTLVHSRPPQTVEVEIDNALSACPSFSNPSSSFRSPEAHNVGPIGRSLSEFTGAGFDAWLDGNEELLVRRAAHLAGHKIESASHLRIFWEAWSRGRLDPLTDRSSIEPFEHDDLLAEGFKYLIEGLRASSAEIRFKSLQQIALFFKDGVLRERFGSVVVQFMRNVAREFFSESHGKETRIRAAYSLIPIIPAVPEMDVDSVRLEIIGALGNAIVTEYTPVNESALQALENIVQTVSAIRAAFSPQIERMPGILEHISRRGETEGIRELAKLTGQHVRERFFPLR